MKRIFYSTAAIALIAGLMPIDRAHGFDANLSNLIKSGSVSPSYTLINNDQMDLEEAKDFIASLSTDGIAFLKDPDLTDVQRKKEFQKLLNKNFDLNTIGRFSMGPYWRQASADQKVEFQKLFDDRIVQTYSNRFEEYQGQEVIVKSARPEGRADILVNSFLVGKGHADVRIDWRLREKAGQFKIIDVLVEGVSMALTQRSDFSSVIQRGGGDIDVLLDHLRM